MLVPLETLAGWPESPDPPVLQALGLLVGFPALAFVVIGLLGKASALASMASGGNYRPGNTVWLGTSPEAGKLSVGTGRLAVEGSKPSAGIGGASVRW